VNEAQKERLVAAAEKYATAQETFALAMQGIYEEAKRVTHRLWPERAELREAIVTRVPTAEDKAREDQGATDTRPIREWATSFGNDEVIGVREREYLERQRQQQDKPSSKAGGQAG
jgi:hypothetical protein